MPPKKKRGKTGPLSEKEMAKKAAKAERKALMEEEKRRKRQELVTSFLKFKFDKEMQISKLNHSKLNLQWRNLLREMKSQEMSDSIETICHRFNVAVDHKNAVIAYLVLNLQQSDEQLNRCQRGHMESLNNLIKIYETRMGEMYKEYEESHDMLYDEFVEEREQIDENHAKATDTLLDVMYVLDTKYEQWENESRLEYQAHKDAAINQQLEERTTLKMLLDGSIEEMWNRIQDALRKYKKDTEEIQKSYEELKSKDERGMQDITRYMARIHKLTDNISMLRAKIADHDDKSQKHLQRLRIQRDALRSDFKAVRTRYDKQRAAHSGQITFLSEQASRALQRLGRSEARGEWILKSAEICRKFEMEEEKVNPFPHAEGQDPLQKAVEEAAREAAQAEAEKGSFLDQCPKGMSLVYGKFVLMERFWQRYNKVLLDTAGFKKEQDVLLQHNKNLKATMRRFLRGLGISGRFTDEGNTLMVVNHKHPALLKDLAEEYQEELAELSGEEPEPLPEKPSPPKQKQVKPVVIQVSEHMIKHLMP